MVTTKPKHNLSGEKFGRLLVLNQADDYVYPSGKRRTQWLCKCDCGNIVSVEQSNLLRSNSTSCGCYNNELRMLRNIKHGDRHTRLYGIWCGIKLRCYNPKSQSFKNYGARGITMCSEWKESYPSFKTWALSAGYNETDHLSIDRIDVNGNYEPSNCKWANPVEQANNRRNTIFISSNGESHTLSEWAKISEIKYHTLYARIYKLGWDIDLALMKT